SLADDLVVVDVVGERTGLRPADHLDVSGPEAMEEVLAVHTGARSLRDVQDRSGVAREDGIAVGDDAVLSARPRAIDRTGRVLRQGVRSGGGAEPEDAGDCEDPQRSAAPVLHLAFPPWVGGRQEARGAPLSPPRRASPERESQPQRRGGDSSLVEERWGGETG